MSEKFPSLERQESTPVTMDQVREALANKGAEHAPSMELLNKWIDQNQEKIEAIANPNERNYTMVSFELAKAELYFEAGYWEEALDSLDGEYGENGLKNIPCEEELYDLILDLIEKIKDHTASIEKVTAYDPVRLGRVEDWSVEQLQEGLAKVIAPDTENYELAAKIRDELNKR